MWMPVVGFQGRRGVREGVGVSHIWDPAGALALHVLPHGAELGLWDDPSCLVADRGRVLDELIAHAVLSCLGSPIWDLGCSRLCLLFGLRHGCSTVNNVVSLLNELAHSGQHRFAGPHE